MKEDRAMNSDSAAAQRERLLRALEHGPVDTVTAYRKLDILHVPSRVFELRRVGLYLLGKLLPTPAVLRGTAMRVADLCQIWHNFRAGPRAGSLYPTNTEGRDFLT